MIHLKNHFAKDHRSHHSDWLRQQQWFIKSRHMQEKRDDKAEKLQDDLLSFASEIILATEIQIQEFNIKLDHYDEAIVKALMDNQVALENVRANIELMLENAYVLEDGRRVFKTEDGTQVFDEHGIEVMQNELNFGLIPPDNKTWQEFTKNLSLEAELQVERGQLIEFQEQLDSAREISARDGVTEKELDDLDADLFEDMPPSVKSNISGFDTAENAPNATTVFAKNATPVVTVTTSSPSQILTYDPMG